MLSDYDGLTTGDDHRNESLESVATDPVEVRTQTLLQIDLSDEFSISKELFNFIKISAPNTLLMFIVYLQMTFTLSTISQSLGTTEMTGISLASLTANLSALTVVYGLLSAVDILAPQSFGAGNLEQVGILVSRGLFCILLVFPLTLLLWLNAEDILLMFGQPRQESHLAGEFLRIHLISVPALSMFESSRRFLWSQEVNQWPFVFISLLALGLHIGFLHWLVPLLGFSGSAWSHVLTSWSMFLLTMVWIVCCRPHRPETAASMCSLRKVCGNASEMKIFLKLALPGILSMSEWVFFELFIFLSGWLGEKQLAANSIAYNLIPMMFTIPSGIAIATTARLGVLLAQGKVDQSKRLSRAVFILTFFLALFIALLILGVRDGIIAAFSNNDDHVRILAEQIWPLMCFFLFLDALFGVQSGLVRSLGMQLYFALLVLLCLFVVGLPLILILAFPFGADLGLLGMWIGFPLVYVLLNVCLFAAHKRKDWQAYSDQVAEREKIAAAQRRRVEEREEGIEV